MSYSAMFEIILFRTNIRRNSSAEYSSETDMYDIVIISQKTVTFETIYALFSRNQGYVIFARKNVYLGMNTNLITYRLP